MCLREQALFQKLGEGAYQGFQRSTSSGSREV